MTEFFWKGGAQKTRAGWQPLEQAQGERWKIVAAFAPFLRVAFCIGLLTILSCLTWAQQPNCDLNGDGIVDVMDVQLIANWAASGECPSKVNVIGPGLCNELAQQLVTKAALGLGCHFVSLSWTASTSRDVSGYIVYRGTKSNDPSPTRLNSVPLAGTSYQDLTVQSGRVYYYKVTAVSREGESGPSNEARVIVP